MSDTAGMTLSLPADRKLALLAEAERIDTSQTYAFRFFPERWFAGAGACCQGLLIVIAGVFLLSQVSKAPSLVAQISVVGGLLTLGGLVFILHSLKDLLGGVWVGPNGLRVQLGVFGRFIPWSQVKSWSVNHGAAVAAGFDSLKIGLTSSDWPYSAPGGHLSAEDHFRLELVLNAFAKDKVI